MKKLERLLEKIIGDKRPSDVLKDVIFAIELIVTAIIGILLAVTFNIYLVLSVMLFLCVLTIALVFVNKVFFRKLNDYLLETPKATTLVLCIMCTVAAVLSWKYFIGVIFSVILAFMCADYIKNSDQK